MKSKIIRFTGAIALSITLVGCAAYNAASPSKLEAAKVCVKHESAFTQQKGSFTDQRDNKTYETVDIGNQTWMAENLSYNASGSKCYGEGAEVRVLSEAGRPAGFTTLSSDEIQANCDKYGRLYDWATAMDFKGMECRPPRLDKSCLKQLSEKHKGICPDGWHIPSDDEWTTLMNFVGDKAGTKLKSSSDWSVCNGTDDYGFAALPGGGGWRSTPSVKEGFGGIGDGGGWWSTTNVLGVGAVTIDIANSWSVTQTNQYYYKNLNKNSGTLGSSTTNLTSIRCVKD